MAAQWYYAKQGKQLGPVPLDQIRKLAAGRQLQPTDLVWTEGMAAWAPAGGVKELFPEGEAKPARGGPPPAAPRGPKEAKPAKPEAADAEEIPDEPTPVPPAGGLLRPFDLRFQHFVTPSLVKIIWIVYLVSAAVTLLLYTGFILWSQPVLWALFSIAGLLLSVGLVTLLVRLWLEAILVLFRIADHLRDIRQQGLERAEGKAKATGK